MFDLLKSLEIPLAVIPVREMVVFPGSVIPVRIGRAKTVAALKAALTAKEPVVVVAQRGDAGKADPRPEDLYKVGVVSTVEAVREVSPGSYQAVLRTIERVRLVDILETGGYLRARAERFGLHSDLDPRVGKALLGSLKSLALEVLDLLPAENQGLRTLVQSLEDVEALAFLCAGTSDASVSEKQEILEMESAKGRVLAVLDLLQGFRESLKVQNDIQEKLSEKVGKAQREAILRHQMDAIREELGEGARGGESSYLQRIEAARLPEEAKRVALEEARRLESLGGNSPEAGVLRNYLDFILALPWTATSETVVDIEGAEKILNQDHYGLEVVKKRILEHLAVVKLKESVQGSILLLVGPPGVGKTSLAQSIARALGRKFVRVSLGGVRDDAEVRGHRRTYVGALPGRILQGLKKAGQRDTVMLLDEIDKLGRGFSGDPAAALLEVLDPEQNHTFSDHYLEIPFDLSGVLFVATANSLESIPGPLRDRMEVIELSGYTTPEKANIAERHILSQQLHAHGLLPDDLVFRPGVVEKLVARYTREAGVRELKRVIGKICRGIAEKKARGAVGPFEVAESDLERLLGKEKFSFEAAAEKLPPGVVTGLAWTPVGGEILFVESSLMPGSGRLLMTGQLGEVMKESAQIAQSLVRSRYGHVIPLAAHRRRDLHIHVPSGAIPKDGPSAGVALFVALVSLYTGKSVSSQIALSGEVTLRGRVMPVGGIREKLMAAHRAGIREVVLSKGNSKDLAEIPADVLSELKVHFVADIAEAVQQVLGVSESPSAAGTDPGTLTAATLRSAS